jgi:5-methyltetrahydrofolate--homocysteine methyltransferase
VPDASRSVPVMQSLLSSEGKHAYAEQVRLDYERIRAQHRDKKGTGPLLSLEAARANGHKTDWRAYTPPAPAKPGLTVLRNYPLAELIDYIDWTPFFQAWELSGPYPKILEDPVVGEAARKVFSEAKDMLAQIVRGNWIRTHGVLALYPAAQVAGEDIEVYRDATRRERLMTWHNLRQQNQKPTGRANLCLADFVAPRDSGVSDWVGAFAVCAGGIEQRVADYEARHDDYNAIMLKVLADRLAEAFAERLHERVRREFWGYAPDERLNNEQLVREGYRGIRPAPGYPACPDHTEKATLWKLLAPTDNAGIQLTESYAMYPTAAVSGWYFSHPGSRYFAVGKVDLDQVQNYAARKKITLDEAQRWLSPILGYGADSDADAA